jgi:hypothetical protein
VTLDVIMAAVLAFGVDWAADEFNGDDKDGKQSPKMPQDGTQPAVGVYGEGNSVSMPSTAIDGPIFVSGEGNTVNVYEPEPVTATP